MGLLSKFKNFMSDSNGQESTIKRETNQNVSEKNDNQFSITYPLFETNYSNVFDNLKKGDMSAFVDYFYALAVVGDDVKRNGLDYLTTLYAETHDFEVLALKTAVSLYLSTLDAEKKMAFAKLYNLANDGSLYAKYFLGVGGATPQPDHTGKRFNDCPKDVGRGKQMLQQVIDILSDKDENYRKAYHTAYGLLSLCYWTTRQSGMANKDGDNVIKAAHYAQIGIKYDDSLSYFVLADMCLVGVSHKNFGNVVEVDFNKALEYLKKSIQYCTLFETYIHYPIALTNLGLLLARNFRDLDSQLIQCRELFENAAKFNYGFAYKQLKIFYENGWGGLEKDLFKAMEMRDKAREAGIDC